MKNSAIFILCLLNVAAFSVYAQKNEREISKGQIGITFSSFGENDVIRFHDLGMKYDFNGFSLFANPYLKVHSLVPFSFDNHHQRLVESGFRFGLMVPL